MVLIPAGGQGFFPSSTPQPSNSIFVQGSKVAKAMKMEKTKVFLTSRELMVGRYQGFVAGTLPETNMAP